MRASVSCTYESLTSYIYARLARAAFEVTWLPANGANSKNGSLTILKIKQVVVILGLISNTGKNLYIKIGSNCGKDT